MSDAFWNKVIDRALRRSTQAQAVLELELLQPVWGGNGEVLRAELSGADVSSVIVKKIVSPQLKKKRADPSAMRTIASYDNELAFYQKHAPTVPPDLKMARLYLGQRLAEGWLFIVEDLGLSGLLPPSKTLSDEQIRAALRWLARLHAHFMSSPGEGLWKAGSYWNLATRKEELSKMTDTRLKNAAAALDEAINGATYKTIIHGDAKTDNFCFSDDEAVAIDFQYAGLGCGMKDVMCLFDSSLSPFEAAVRVPALLDGYFQELSACLARTDQAEHAASIEHEWRALYPVAWADYYRFLDGWALGRYPPQGYVDEMTQVAVECL